MGHQRSDHGIHGNTENFSGGLCTEGGEVGSDGEADTVLILDDKVKVSKLAAASVSFHFSSSSPHWWTALSDLQRRNVNSDTCKIKETFNEKSHKPQVNFH